MEFDQDNALGLIAGIGIVLVVAALLFCWDLILVPAKPAATWARFRWLRLIGREEYVGRHRFA